ncbi:uncharacterized protein LOC109606449 [Aethina tumida]|uniref:uncharacterized protein LOC109606449 n=1 Tax=Aethina tumida TaxID=116153 RepID=UPI002147F4A4|nr:uncharacterized protein LOC109606449 [Aethina tumida]
MSHEQMQLENVLNNIYNNKFILDDRQRRLLLDYVKAEALNTNQQISNNTSIFFNWIANVVQSWKYNMPSIKSMIFFIELLTPFTLNELNFLLLHQDDTLVTTIATLNRMNVTKEKDLMKVYLNMLNSFTYSEYSNRWLSTTFYSWCNIFETIATELVPKELVQFTINFQANVIEDNKLLLLDFTKKVYSPFLQLNDKITGNLYNITEQELKKELMPTLKFLDESFVYTFANIQKISHWIRIDCTLLNFNELLNSILIFARDPDLIIYLSKLLLSMKLLELKNYECHKKFINNLKCKIIEILLVIIDKNCPDIVHEVVFHCIVLWHHINKIIDVPSLQLDDRLDLFLIFLLRMPSFTILFQVYGRQLFSLVANDDIRELVRDDVVKSMDREEMNVIRKYKDLLVKESRPQLCAQSIQSCVKARHMCSRTTVNFLFQCLVYGLDDVAPDILRNNGFKSPYYNEEYLLGTLDGLTIFIEEFDLSWKDAVQSIDVLRIITDYVTNMKLSSEMIIKFLNLAKLCINKHMCSNMILLMETEDSPLNVIGILVHSFLCGDDTKISEEALDLLRVICKKAKLEYPLLEKIIINSELHTKILSIAMTNKEQNLRLKAIKCLKHMVNITKIWKIVSSRQLLDEFIGLLKNERVDALRAEAVTLISIIYSLDYFFEDQVNEIYKIVTHLGVYDYDLNVRINILYFWEEVIAKLLSEQGMIDNEFPEVTFSKDSKKIVVLDEVEIIKRLRKVMNTLSDTGCLFVLSRIAISSKKEESNVCRNVINKLLTILERYNVNLYNIESDESYCKNISSKIRTDFYADTEIVTAKVFLMNIIDINSKVMVINDVKIPSLAEILGNILQSNKDVD